MHSTSLLDLTACTPRTHCPSAKARQCSPGGLQKIALLAEGTWVLFISDQGCAGLSEGQAGPLDLNLTFWFWYRARVPWSEVQGDLESSAIIWCAEENHRELFPKPLEDRGRAGAAVLAGITNITFMTLDRLRSHPHHAVHSHTSLPASRAGLQSKFQLFTCLRYADT